jgi:Flp pilus assembly protein TadD
VERRRGNFGTAEGLHKMALKTRPGDWRIEREYGLTLIRSHGFASAKPLLEKHRMKRELGEPALAAGDLQLAMSVLGTVAKDQELLLLYSRACIENNRAEEVVAHLQAQTQIDIDGSVHTLLGKAYQQMHRPNPAGLALLRGSALARAAASLTITSPSDQ